MRLRLNISTKCMSYLFNMSNPTASRLITRVVNIMFIKLKFLVKWPDRMALQKTMPMQFRRHFGKKCVVIIDCFEVFTDRSSNLLARAQTWSQYKHHNTAKFLIGITPQGKAINYNFCLLFHEAVQHSDKLFFFSQFSTLSLKVLRKLHFLGKTPLKVSSERGRGLYIDQGTIE